MKIICILAYGRDGYIGVPRPYAQALIRCNACPVLGVWAPKEIVAFAEGIVLTGGGDLSPEVIPSAQPQLLTGCDPVRDRFELEVCRRAVEKHIPLLGICRGAQVINAALGGSLIEDLAAAGLDGRLHHQPAQLDTPVHDILLKENTRLRALACCDRIRVNSTHHQACGRLGDGLRAAAYGEDGILEGFEGDGILGVQFHPERLFARHSFFENIYRWIVDYEC